MGLVPDLSNDLGIPQLLALQPFMCSGVKQLVYITTSSSAIQYTVGLQGFLGAFRPAISLLLLCDGSKALKCK